MLAKYVLRASKSDDAAGQVRWPGSQPRQPVATTGVEIQGAHQSTIENYSQEARQNSQDEECR